jgi:type I restriction enzyme R subunit
LLKLAEERGETSSGILPTRKCAAIVDEAHSLQSGETATELKGVLAQLSILDEVFERNRGNRVWIS